MFWIIFAAIWIICSIFSYILFKKIGKIEWNFWCNSDRFFGILFSLFGPAAFILFLLVFVITKITYSDNNWLNKPAKW